MPLLDVLRYLTAVVLTGVLIWAAVSDVRDRRIPNKAVLSVLGLFGLWAVANGGAGLASAVVAGAIAFAVAYGLYVFKIVGAGDAKLFAALALFAGLSHLPLFALATAWTGGLMALVSLAASPRRAMIIFAMRGQGDHGRGIPYGVAIGVGAAVVLWGYLSGVLPMTVQSVRIG